jgi:hypothetical protein
MKKGEIESRRFKDLAAYIRTRHKESFESYGYEWVRFVITRFFSYSPNFRTFLLFKQKTGAYSKPPEEEKLLNDLDVICDLVLKEKDFDVKGNFCAVVGKYTSAIEFDYEIKFDRNNEIVETYTGKE